ncbi:MAG: 16S rRNA (uracil(1498)-N(3))-methyltransferase [Deltaproteobacteria bacterium]|nr:16S rRNA (uracil(1498)-N(3))-methyltransferase [Deltaproteobacteria bacterium]
MRRFFVEQIPSQGKNLIINGAEAGHITRVLRMAPGAHILLMDERGALCEAVIVSAGRREVDVHILRALAPPLPSPIEITLCQALLKAAAMDFTIQKASELGAHKILPFSSQRTVVRLNRDGHAAKTRHWREIAVHASKQSGRTRPPVVNPPSSLADLAEQWKDEKALKLILWEDEHTQNFKDLLRGSDPWRKVVGIIGPEGGFSGDEVEKLRQAGFRSVTLGRRILRAETAALALLAILQYEWGDMGNTA